MTTESDRKHRLYRVGFDDGYHAVQVDQKTNTPGVQQQFYDLTPHDLDTLAMGIALIVLHATDIRTIEATWDTQSKLGLGIKTLGWLHLLATRPEGYGREIALDETSPNPWLNPDTVLGRKDAADDDPLPKYADWPGQEET
jgi:hypothetical protein